MQTIRKARKAHTCECCHKVISVGTQYVDVRRKELMGQALRFHRDCRTRVNLRQVIDKIYLDFGWSQRDMGFSVHGSAENDYSDCF